MQTLKDEVRNEIINRALEIFLRDGYLKASVRAIAKSAGISVSNLYNYYKNKEDIFYSITAEGYSHFSKISQAIVGYKKDAGDFARTYLIPEISSLIKRHRVCFLLMMTKGEGTKYEGHRMEIVTFLKNHFLEFLSADRVRDELIMTIAANNLIAGLIEIAKEEQEGQWVDENIEKLISYHLYGILKLKTKK